MKKLVLAAVCWLAFMPFSNAQTKTSCCAKPATEQFAAFASSQEFKSGHESPLPFTLENEAGEMISFPVAGGDEGRAYIVKSEKETTKYLILIHEYWGLNDYIKQKADEYAKTIPGINVIAVDLYDGKIATDPETAGKYVQEVDTERATAILKGLLAYTGKKAEIQTLGWCFGGGWSLQTALMAGKNAKGCVMYYGMPEKDVKKLKTLKCDVMGVFAKKDQWITPKIVTEFQKNMKEAGKVLVAKTFDADHAFANPSSPNYNNKNAIAADKMTLDFLKKRFNPAK
jgi:carboxymethylenebutenolidase